MDRELVRQSQSEHREAANGTSPQTTTTECSTPTTPNPPPLTPNPMLLDSPAPTTTPTTSSPPPPLTPAPSVSAIHGPKLAGATAGAPSPHILVPAPPKLTSTSTSTLRTYSRPILPSPAGVSKTAPATQSSTSLLPPFSSSSSSAVASTTLSHSSTNSLTNGRPASTSTSTPITPFHTPASPPGRQISQTHPVGTSGLVRANQSLSPVRQRVSQQTLLLGKGLKGSGQDQVLLRAQMLILTSAMRPALSSSSSSTSSSPPSSTPASAQLQSLTLRPPPPGTLAIPPSLRLKASSSAPPPLSRPHIPLFPPLRPRPLPSSTATESPTTPSRHLSVPPPTLYSPTRAIPLRPRLHRSVAPRQTLTPQPIAVAPASNPLAGLKGGPLTQTVLGTSQSQHSSLPLNNPLSISPDLEHSPSAARQLQIIALSSGRQPQSGSSTHAVQSVPPTAEASELSRRRTSSNEDGLSLPQSPALPKPTSPIHSPPSLLSPASPLSQAGPQTHTVMHKCEAKESQEKGRGLRRGIGDEGCHDKDLKVEKADQREQASEDKQSLSAQKDGSLVSQKEQETERAGEEERMEVTEEGQSDREMAKRVEKGETVMDQSENLPTQVLHQDLDTLPVLDSAGVKDSSMEPKPILGLNSAPGPVPAPVPEASVQSERLSEPQREPQSGGQEDFCENMSTQSDNQSALSSLSSQSPPASPFITPPAENPPRLLLPQTTQLTDLSLSQREETEKADKPVADELQPQAETATGTEHLSQSEDESESFSQSLGSPWELKAWPEGRQVLTHLVEGFVIREGLEPFPVNRSSLLVPGEMSKPQEVNGTNGRAASPARDKMKSADQSSDSEQDEAGDEDELANRSAHRDRTVLHCQFCGKRGHAHNFMRSKRFCSTSCARGFNVRLTKRLRALSTGNRPERPRPPALNRAESVPGKPLLLRLPRDLWSAGRREKDGKEKVAVVAAEEEEEEEDMEGAGEEEEEEEEDDDDDDGGEEGPTVTMTARMEHQVAQRARRASAPAMTASTPTTTFRPAPSQWSVEEVTSFITTLPGCSDVAEAFRLQEIDGQALLLLTEDHLMTSMNIKLGPALKICAHINSLKNQ